MTIKKASIIFTLAILETESEYSNPISQSKIAQMLTEAKNERKKHRKRTFSMLFGLSDKT